MEFAYEWGYLGLFIISFLAASILPLSPEVLMVLLYTQGYSAIVLIIVATISGYLGSLTYYFAAIGGRNLALQRWIKIEPEKLAKTQARFERWGSIILFFSWLPIVGEPLIIAAGLLKVRFAIFSFWVIFGRLLRFIVVLLIASLLVN
jgi:membrane protein YqaA with SNARE-associated domain